MFQRSLFILSLILIPVRPRSPVCVSARVCVSVCVCVCASALSCSLYSLPVSLSVFVSVCVRACACRAWCVRVCMQLSTSAPALTVVAPAASQVSCLWWSIGPILRALHQPPAVCVLAPAYTRILIAGMVPNFAFEALRRFLQCQGVAKPMLIVSVLTSLVHPAVNALFIFKLGFGFYGAAMAVVASQWFMLLALLTYTLVRRPFHPDTWPGWTREALSELCPYFKLAVPGGEPRCVPPSCAIVVVFVTPCVLVILSVCVCTCAFASRSLLLNLCVCVCASQLPCYWGSGG